MFQNLIMSDSSMHPKKKAPKRKKHVSKVRYALPYDQQFRIPYPQGKPATEEFVKQQFDTYIAKLGRDPVNNSLDDYLRQMRNVSFIPATEPPRNTLIRRQYPSDLSEYRSEPVEPVEPVAPSVVDNLMTVEQPIDMREQLEQ